ncbi:hypothetical protein F2Q69_00026956 [Brassica cretica]|uniref:Uncharacterized protein n=1 Tax=Brassica cretica TaxID=69181 RepID=A0A8S9S5I4_BRACR|nr:hypothetical protein F2Q69_00026956 [Brassica cretica]
METETIETAAMITVFSAAESVTQRRFRTRVKNLFGSDEVTTAAKPERCAGGRILFPCRSDLIDRAARLVEEEQVTLRVSQNINRRTSTVSLQQSYFQIGDQKEKVASLDGGSVRIRMIERVKVMHINETNSIIYSCRIKIMKQAPWELGSDQRNTRRTSSNLDIETLRPKISRSFSDNLLLLGELNLEEPILENPEPSREGLNGVIWETTSESGFIEAEPTSPRCFHSAIVDEDHLRRTGSRQMLQGSSSMSDFLGQDDVPGFSHSYNARFTPADEMFELCSSVSSDNMFTDMDESITSTTDTNILEFHSSSNQPGRFIEFPLVDGYSNEFTQWVLHEKSSLSRAPR